MDLEFIVNHMHPHLKMAAMQHKNEHLRFIQMVSKKYTLDELTQFCMHTGIIPAHRKNKRELAEQMFYYLIGATNKHTKVVFKIDTTCSEFDCSICFETCMTFCSATLQCGHVFCGGCMNELFQSKHYDCAMCRKHITQIEVMDIELYNQLTKKVKC